MMRYRSTMPRVLSILVIYHTTSAVSFITLHEARAYAARLPEYVLPDNGSGANPDFFSFQQEQRPYWVRRIFSWLGGSYPIWDARKFKSLIRSLLVTRERDGLHGMFAERCVPTKGNSIIVWGIGTLHSMIRDLSYLEKCGIISNEFKIMHPHYRFVFTGNLFEGSPYALELLTIIARLLAVNHNRVFYIRSDHEDGDHWHTSTLGQALTVRARHVSRETIPLRDMITRFFNTLPSALYFVHDTKEELQAVVITNNESKVTTFVHNQIGWENEVQRGFFKGSGLAHHTSPKLVIVKAYIASNHDPQSQQQSQGIALHTDADGAHWSFTSVASERQPGAYVPCKGFICLNILGGIDQWTIASGNRCESCGEHDASTILLLQGTRTETKQCPCYAKPLLQEYTSDQIQSMLETIPVHVRPSYAREGMLLAQYAVQHMRSKKILFLYQNDTWGQRLMVGAQNILLDNEEVVWKKVPYEPEELNFYEQVKLITAYTPDTIVFFSTAKAAKELLSQLGAYLVPGSSTLLGCSALGDEKFLRFMRATHMNVKYTSVVPHPQSSQLPIVVQFLEAAQAQGLEPTSKALKAYIASDLLLHILGQLEGEPTSAQVIGHLEEMQDMEYKGLSVHFDPQERTLLHSMWLASGTSKWEQLA